MDSSEKNSRSRISVKIDQLKSNVSAVVKSRENLPHLLFWSLLHQELDQIKQEKLKERKIKEIIFGIE